MSITNKVTVGLVSIALVFSVVVGVSANAQDKDALIAQLREQIRQLAADLAGDSSGSSTTRVVSSSSNAACPHTWTSNLAVGSTGDDVRQLQRFLNGNPQTQVATTGVGSPGNETSYYGPATARAVSRFQEMYAAQILTPLGLTKGTGGFYTSTRKQANNLCASGSGTYTTRSSTGVRSAVSAPIVQVTGDALAITPGNPISDAYVVQGAQRAPFTSVVLTAGNDSVRVESIRIKRFGLSSSDNFESVALVDAGGVQIGTARSLNSRDEVNLGGNLVIPANRSVTLAIVGNMTNGDDFSPGSIAGLEVAGVTANTRVQGNFPIRGAAHVLSDSITLQKITVDVGGGGEDIEFNEDTEVAAINIDIDGAVDPSETPDGEDAYLRSIILKQEGSADTNEIGDVEVYVDGDRTDYTLNIDRDRYVINFGGRGVLIEENDNVEVTVDVNTNEGYEETVQFSIEDESDVYVVGAGYGYGLPVEFAYDKTGCDDRLSTCSETDDDGYQDTTASAMILSGTVRDGGQVSRFEDEVKHGNDVILGALSVELEGEDIEMEDLTFSVTLDDFPWTSASENAWEDAEEDTVTLDNVQLRIDGQVVAYADDGNIDFDEPSSDAAITINNIDFSDNFTIDVREETEVKFEIVADLDEAWGHFNGATIEFELTDVDMAEGVRSDKDYTDSGEYFASDRAFEEVEILGNVIEFTISNAGVDDEEFVAGKEGVVFGTLEVDASNTVDDIELDSLYISFFIPSSETGDLSNIEGCRILDRSGDEVGDSNSRINGTTAGSGDQMKFRFDDVVIESEEDAEFDIVCDIDRDAEAGQKYQLDADTTEGDKIEYNIGRDGYEHEFTTSDDSDVITISAGGTLTIETDTPDNESTVAYAVGSRGEDGIETMEITFEAEDEDISILDIYLSGVNVGVPVDAEGNAVTISESELRKLVGRVSIDGYKAARPGDFESTAQTIVLGNCEDADSDCSETDDVTTGADVLVFDRVNQTIESGEEVTVNLTIDYRGIDDNVSRTRAGQWLEAAKIYVKYQGEDSEAIGKAEETISTDFVKNIVFPSIPTISTNSRDTDLRNGNDREIYEFTVTAADEGPVYVKQVGITATNVDSGVTLTNVVVKNGGDTSASGTLTTGSTTKFAFTDAVRVSAGESETFVVEATVAGAVSDKSVTVELAADAIPARASRKTGQAFAAGIGNFVWSPDTLGERGDAGTDNKDWFSGGGIFESNDIDSWTLERD